MNDDPDIVAEDPHQEIARLETRIEELADDIERCRKIAIFARVLAGAGAFWLAAELLGLASFGAPGLMGSIAAILGAFILGGSNRSSMMQAQAALDAAEDRRTALIGAIELRTVEPAAETRRWLH